MIEIKVTTATVGALVASACIEILNAFATDHTLLGSIPPWLQFLIITITPPLLTFLAGYAMPSNTSSVSRGRHSYDG